MSMLENAGLQSRKFQDRCIELLTVTNVICLPAKKYPDTVPLDALKDA